MIYPYGAMRRHCPYRGVLDEYEGWRIGVLYNPWAAPWEIGYFDHIQVGSSLVIKDHSYMLVDDFGPNFIDINNPEFA